MKISEKRRKKSKLKLKQTKNGERLKEKSHKVPNERLLKFY